VIGERMVIAENDEGFASCGEDEDEETKEDGNGKRNGRVAK
jgi:hypothetical protein